MPELAKTNIVSKTLYSYKKDFLKHWKVYALVFPVLAYYIIFCYVPMGGIVIAFKDYRPMLGIWGSKWLGFKYFESFFSNYYFFRLIRNTLNISFTTLVWGFPAPILFALLINKVHKTWFKKTVQTITYLPHFISVVVICGMIRTFTGANGLITSMLTAFGVANENMLFNPKYFVPIYVISGIWQEIGWGSIIYLAALSGVSQELYEAAYIDGAGRLRQVFHVSLPSIAPTIVTLLILRMGGLMSVGFEKIILLYNDLTMESADVISSYVYRKGLQQFEYGFATAVGLFNSAINFTIVVMANKISKKISDTSLW